MVALTAPDPIAIWIEGGRPSRLIWHGVRYRVTDTPTPLRDEVAHPLLTHPIVRQVGWRFQGTPAKGPSLVFDVRGVDGGWELIRVYE